MSTQLNASGLQKNYQMGEVTIEALKGVDFSVKKGEFVAIMGPSGSGKSTLLHLLGGLDTSSDGEVTLAGKQLTFLNDDEITVLRRRKVGFVFQFFNLLPMLTAVENVGLPLMLDGMRERDYLPRAQEMMDLVGLIHRMDHKPSQLSGGEQQRVAIARALVNEPDILLADEPTGELDRRSGERLLRILRNACDDRGQSIVIVTHDPYAASFADRVVFLWDGELVHELRDQVITVKIIVDLLAQLEG